MMLKARLLQAKSGLPLHRTLQCQYLCQLAECWAVYLPSQKTEWNAVSLLLRGVFSEVRTLVGFTCQLPLYIHIRPCKQSQFGAQCVLVCLFIFSTRFGRLCAHHQEKQMYLSGTWYFVFSMEHMLLHTRQSPTQSSTQEHMLLHTTQEHMLLRTRQSFTREHMLLHTRQSYTQERMFLHTRESYTRNNKYQVWHKYSCFSWWWAHSRPKHVEKRNKHTKKNCAPGWLYLQDYTRMHGQQNLKYTFDVMLHPRWINKRWLQPWWGSTRLQPSFAASKWPWQTQKVLQN